MDGFRKIMLAGAMAAATSTMALAADLPEPPYIELPPEVTPVEFASGWYLRGDIGYTTFSDHNVTFYSDQRYSFDDQDIDGRFLLGVGFGYTINDYFRVDATIDHSFSADWHGSTTGSSCGVTYTGECYSYDEANQHQWTGLFNAYYDLGHFHGIVPYVGAGLGASYVSWNDYTTTPTCTLDPGETCEYGTHTGGTDAESFTGTPTSFSTESDWRFSYALMAGFSYDIDARWKFDANYRLLSVGDGTIINASGTGLNGDVEFDDYYEHQFRVGLRYQIW